MKIVVCAKEVRDPDAVDNYVLNGNLEIGADGKTLTQASIPRLMNAYDEQAIEAALRLRDKGTEFTLSVVSIGKDPGNILRHAAAMGADDIVQIDADAENLDGVAIATLLAAYVRSIGGADLIFGGRQASDDDQGVVPALLGELLDLPVVTVARAVELSGATLRVTRVTPNGDEIVETSGPAVVTISNELGTPRYPTTARTMKARRMKPAVVTAEQLGVGADAVKPRVSLTRQYVASVQGSCEMLSGDSPAAVAAGLLERLRAAQAIG